MGRSHSYSQIKDALDAKKLLDAFEGGRTALFLKRFSHRAPNFDIVTLTYKHGEDDYSLVTRREPFFFSPERKFVSIDACGPRCHLILLDPASPKLDEIYQNFKHTLPQGKKLKALSLLKKLGQFLYHALSEDAHTLEELNQILEEHKDYTAYKNSVISHEHHVIASNHRVSQRRRHSVYAVPIETFFAHHIGVCRHHALATSYFISRLIEDGLLPKGQVFNHRDRDKRGFEGKSAKGSPHVWVIYKTQGGTLYHVDSYWQEAVRLYVKDEQLEKSATRIESRYGPGVLDLIEKRYTDKCISIENMLEPMRITF